MIPNGSQYPAKVRSKIESGEKAKYLKHMGSLTNLSSSTRPHLTYCEQVVQYQLRFE